MSHCDAAYAQLRAEKAARACGLDDAYGRALDYGEGWLAGPMPAVRRGRAKAGQVPCPLPIAEIGPELRLRPNCRRCTRLAALIRAEKARRAEEAAFMQLVHRAGYRCCETMAHCALRGKDAEAKHGL